MSGSVKSSQSAFVLMGVVNWQYNILSCETLSKTTHLSVDNVLWCSYKVTKVGSWKYFV
jgi:hypothetical protein